MIDILGVFVVAIVCWSIWYEIGEAIVLHAQRRAEAKEKLLAERTKGNE